MREDETEGTQVEDLDAQIAALRAQKRERRLIAQQRKMLPGMEKRGVALATEAAQIKKKQRALDDAFADIEAGKLTEYRLRAKPVRRAKKEQAE